MTEISEPSTKQSRVMVWTAPQSISTAFQKCLSYVDDIQIINEPYISASANNTSPAVPCTEDAIREVCEEATNKHPLGAFITDLEGVHLDEDLDAIGWDNTLWTSSWVKGLLEGELPGKKVIFAKDMILGIRDQYHVIPKGYKHTFLIRNPTKLTLSQGKITKLYFPLPDDGFSLLKIPLEMRDWYGPILDFIQYLKAQNIESNPVIIDADDLQDYPESIMRQYCEAVGIPYTDRLLHWPAGMECVKKNWIISKFALRGNEKFGFYKVALASTKFEPSKPLPPLEEIPSDVIEVANHQEPYYRKLYKMRIRPQE